MKIKRIAFGFLVLLLLACNYVTQMIWPPTVTPVPTATATFIASPSPTATPLVPAYIPPQCDPVSSLATLPPDIAIHPTPQFETKPISRQMQLDVFDQITQIVNEVYVYPDFNGKDWKAITEKYRAKVKAGMDTNSFYEEMYSMVAELGDDHSAFISPAGVEQSREELEGKKYFVGVGIRSDVDFERGRMTVLSTFPGSPAEYAGLQSHDSILLIDGQPITREGGIRTLGPECTAVRLTVQSPGEPPREVMLIRAKVEGNVPVESRLATTMDGSKIGYIFIPSFFDESIPDQIENALKDFGDLDGLILDVRLNGGGSLAIGEAVLGFFTHGKMGDIVSRTDSYEVKVEENPVHNSQTVPLVVLVDDRSASFSEIFAGLLRDVRGAKIAGQTTLGNVEVLSRNVLDDGSWLWLAESTFDSAYSDTNWEQTGIVPDIEAYAPWDSFYFDTDPAIAASLKLLGHQE